MGLNQITHFFAWSEYSKKLISKIETMRSSGFYLKEDVEERGMKLFVGSEGEIIDGNAIDLFFMIDPDDGIIVDAKYQVFGQTALIGALESFCEICVGKNYDQAKRIGTDLIDQHLRDSPNKPAFPKETYPHLNLVLSAAENALEKCEGIPLSEYYVAPPAPKIGEMVEGGFPGWETLTLKQKLQVIEDVLDRDVRPYIALDAGGIEVLNLLNDREVIIAYQGTCTSCISSVGATLSYIQQTLKNKVSPDIVVIPNL